MEILDTISNISGLGIGALAILALIYFLKNGNFKRIEKNHLPHIEEILKDISNKLDKIEDKMESHNLLSQRIFDKLSNNK